jgi:hypothetical protein
MLGLWCSLHDAKIPSYQMNRKCCISFFLFVICSIFLPWSVALNKQHQNDEQQQHVNTAKHKVDASMQKQCILEGVNASFSNQKELDVRYSCPKFIRSANVGDKRFQCNRTSSFFFPLHSMSNFVQFLDDNNMTILYVGDSIQSQMVSSISCALEAENPDPSDLKTMRALFAEHVLFYSSAFLARTPKNCVVNKPGFNNARLQFHGWFEIAIAQKVTHVVLNTGAWWFPDGIYVNNKKSSQYQANKCFFRHFGPRSKLSRLLRILKHRHGIVSVWRDITPGGVCDKGALGEGRFNTYYTHFFAHNVIARASITSPALQGLVIPGVWENSLSKWREHMGEGDMLHWCMYTEYNVPLIWNSLLYELLNKTKAKSLATVRSDLKLE